jgi:hypothetical protein
MGGKLGTPLQRFEWSYMPEPNTGCWLWLKSISEFGYGWFYYPPRNMVAAHIVAWELLRGPRNGLHVLHNCDNPTCVNPEHLRLGTLQDNMNDREARHRRPPPKGTINGRAKLTDAQVLAIRADPRWPRFIARDYKTPTSTIKKIKYRHTWKHLP